MFSKRPYYKWLVVTLICSVVLSIVVVVLYHLDILNSDNTNSEKILDITLAPNKEAPKAEEAALEDATAGKKYNKYNGKTWNHPIIQNRSLHGVSFFLQISLKFANALDLLESRMRNELIAAHLKQIVKDAFSRAYEIVYEDERIIQVVMMFTSKEVLSSLEKWRGKILKIISPEFVEKLRTSFPELKTSYKNIYRYFLLFTFEFKSVPIPKEDEENVKKAQEYVFQRYVRERIDVELLEDAASNALIDLLADPRAKECLIHVFGESKPNTIRFLTSKPEKTALIAWLDKKMRMISSVPLLLAIQTLLEEPLVENVATVTSVVANDPFYDVAKGLIFRLINFVDTLEQQQQKQECSGEQISSDIAFIIGDREKSNGYLKAAVSNFFEDLPKHREELEALLGVRPARDTLLSIMKWNSTGGVAGVYAQPAKTPFKIVEGVGRCIVFLESKFGISLGVFYKAFFRVCQPTNQIY